MRKQGFVKRIVGSVMALAVAFCLMPVANVNAASEYTVTFRPGNVGQFGIGSDAGDRSAMDMAQEVADIYYAQYETSVTQMGAIKVKVPAGADVPAIPGYVIPDAGYCVRTWGPEAGEKVTKNVDYVVDYGRLTDGVEYTVKYVDEQSGESIAPFMTTYANIGDAVTVSAPNTITISDAGVYELTSAGTQTITLAEDAELNVVTFTYAYSYEPGSVVEDVVVSVPGDTVVTTQTVTTFVNNGTTVEDSTALAEQEAEADQELVGIDDENTPLADNEDESEELTEIWDEKTPLFNLGIEGMNMAVVWAGIFGVAAVILAIVWLFVRRKKNDAEEA